MSTTRKIEGIANLTDNDEITLSIEPNTSPVHIYKEPATLVIGGKCLTEEEHEAEFQRRAAAVLAEIAISPNLLTETTWTIQQIAAKHGIKP